MRYSGQECPPSPAMRDLNELFQSLRKSAFRSRFHLKGRELEYLHEKGLGVVLVHARDFIEKRLAPSTPENDGKQTPTRNHPVFIAQHATATCCRGCLEKWHSIPKGRTLSDTEIEYIIKVLSRWMQAYTENE